MNDSFKKVGIRTLLFNYSLAIAGDDYATLRHRCGCDAIREMVASAGRAIVYPTLLISERPSEFVDGIEVTVTALTVPMGTA